MPADAPAPSIIWTRLLVPGLAIVAAVLRIPAFLAQRHLSFDDGVYGASAVAMRHGAAPFRNVFSSQGPLFLPLVRLADLMGLETRGAPRLLAVASGVVITVAVFSIGARLAGRGAGVLAALLVATSGSVLWVTAGLASDGPTLAFATAAVAVLLAYRDEPSPWKAAGIGLLMGAAFSVKSLLAVPPGVAVAWVLLGERRWRDLSVGLGAAVVVVVGTALPFGLSRVWDQAFAYHLEATGGRRPVANLRKVFSTLWDRDVLVLMFFVIAAVVTVALWWRPAGGESATGRASPWSSPAAPVVAWLVATLVVLVTEQPMWRPHLAHLVPPLALIAVWWVRARLTLFAFLAAVLGVAHGVSVWGIVVPGGYTGNDAAAVTALDGLPHRTFAITDEPGLVWRAGLRTPPDLVDTSILRIESGRISTASVTRAAARPGVCALLVWSTRFGGLDLGAGLARHGYRVQRTFGGPRVLYLRDRCPRA